MHNKHVKDRIKLSGWGANRPSKKSQGTGTKCPKTGPLNVEDGKKQGLSVGDVMERRKTEAPII